MSKIIKNIIHSLGSRILFFFLVLVDRSVKIRIVKLHSSRIGHLIFNFENFYFNFYLKNKNLNFFYIVLLDKKISNKKIFKILKTKVKGFYLYGFFLYFFESIASEKLRDQFYIPWSVLHPYKSKIAIMPCLITKNDVGNPRSVSDLNLKKNSYVVFHSRDDLYLQHHKLEDGNDHSYRNFNFSNFNNSVDYLLSRDVKSVRIGQVSEVNLYENKYLDLSNSNFDDELKLISESKFLVSGNSGIAQISTLLRKSQLYVNYIPLRLDHLASMAPNSIVIPKHISRNDSDRLTLEDLFRIAEDWSIHDNDYIKEQNLIIKDNSESEILFGVQEMFDFLETYKKNESDKKTNTIYDKIVNATHDKEFAKYIFFELKITFSSTFLRQFL